MNVREKKPTLKIHFRYNGAGLDLPLYIQFLTKSLMLNGASVDKIINKSEQVVIDVIYSRHQVHMLSRYILFYISSLIGSNCVIFAL